MSVFNNNNDNNNDSDNFFAPFPKSAVPAYTKTLDAIKNASIATPLGDNNDKSDIASTKKKKVNGVEEQAHVDNEGNKK